MGNNKKLNYDTQKKMYNHIAECYKNIIEYAKEHYNSEEIDKLLKRKKVDDLIKQYNITLMAYLMKYVECDYNFIIKSVDEYIGYINSDDDTKRMITIKELTELDN